MQDLTVCVIECPDGSLNWVWFDPDGVAWMGNAMTEDEALEAAAQTREDWFRHVH